MNKMNYLFDACVSHRNTQKLNNKLNNFFADEEAKFYAESNQHMSGDTRNSGCSLYVRCMSRKEYNYLMNGKIITNTIDHSHHAFSDSKGFCFFKYTNDEDALFQYAAWLHMFADDAVMLVVSLPDAMMKKSMGYYGGGWKTEYCTTQLYITQGMVHHTLFNISSIIENNDSIQERLEEYHDKLEDLMY